MSGYGLNIEDGRENDPQHAFEILRSNWARNMEVGSEWLKQALFFRTVSRISLRVIIVTMFLALGLVLIFQTMKIESVITLTYVWWSSVIALVLWAGLRLFFSRSINRANQFYEELETFYEAIDLEPGKVGIKTIATRTNSLMLAAKGDFIGGFVTLVWIRNFLPFQSETEPHDGVKTVVNLANG